MNDLASSLFMGMRRAGGGFSAQFGKYATFRGTMRAAAVASLAALALALPAGGQEASMFRGNLAHSGIYPGTGVPKLDGIKWKFKTGGQVISSPAVAGGVIYVGSTDRNLYALDAATGAEKWKFTTGSAVVSSPAVSGNSVYFESYDGFFYALDTATGKLEWKFETANERRFEAKHLHGLLPAAEIMPDPWDFFLSSPAVWQGAVYFGSGDGNVYALDAATGAKKWSFKTGDVVHSSPAIAGGMLYIGSWDGYFYALDAATGEKKWSFKTGDDPAIHNHVGIQSSPVVADGTVYFGCRDANVYALDAATGKEKWVYSTRGSWVNNSPVVYDGKVYFGWSLPGRLEAVDAKAGERVSTVDTKVPMFSSMAISDGMIYAGTFDGKLTAYDVASQKPAWTFQTDGSKEHLSALTNADGTINWSVVVPQPFYNDMVTGVSKLFTAGTILSSPVVANGTIYVGSTDGYLYALM